MVYENDIVASLAQPGHRQPANSFMFGKSVQAVFSRSKQYQPLAVYFVSAHHLWRSFAS